MNRARAAGWALALLGGAVATTRAVEARPAPLTGRLLEARCWLTTGAAGGEHTACAFRSALGNLPLGLLTDDGAFVYLAEVPSRLAEHVTRRARARARTTPDGRLARLVTLEVWRDGRWHGVHLRR